MSGGISAQIEYAGTMLNYVLDASPVPTENDLFFGISNRLSVGASGGGYALMFAHMSSLIMVGEWAYMLTITCTRIILEMARPAVSSDAHDTALHIDN